MKYSSIFARQQRQQIFTVFSLFIIGETYRFCADCFALILGHFKKFFFHFLMNGKPIILDVSTLKHIRVHEEN